MKLFRLIVIAAALGACSESAPVRPVLVQAAEDVTDTTSTPGEGDATGTGLDVSGEPDTGPQRDTVESPIQCPDGALLWGDAPPEGYYLWCEKPTRTRHGREVVWHPNGNVMVEQGYEHGQLRGWRKQYLFDGFLLWEMDDYGWDVQYTKTTTWALSESLADENRQKVREIAQYLGDVRHGRTQELGIDGLVRRDGSYNMGEECGWHLVAQVGPWEEHDPCPEGMDQPKGPSRDR